MTIEANLKHLLGEYIFQICALQHQVTELTKEVESLKDKKEKK